MVPMKTLREQAELIADNIECASQVRWSSDSHREDAVRNIEDGVRRTLEAERQWRPIESAPKDGTRVLVYWPYWCPTEPCIAYYSGSTGGWEGERCLTPTHEIAFPERQPTHFMLIPPPPGTTP